LLPLFKYGLRLQATFSFAIITLIKKAQNDECVWYCYTRKISNLQTGMPDMGEKPLTGALKRFCSPEMNSGEKERLYEKGTD